jgi:hypothetical protein
MSLHGSTARPAAHPTAPPTSLPLERLVDEVDRTHPPEPHASILRVTERPLQVGRLLLDDGGHPLDLLLGFTAPPGWAAIGLRCLGHAYDLVDEPPPAAGPIGPTEAPEPAEPITPTAPAEPAAPDPPGGPPEPDQRVVPVPVVVTVLLDRTGHGAGTLRRGDAVTRLDGPPEGVVGDACRRALGLPTRPPPSSTVDLWLRIWLDRLIETTIFADDAGRLTSWSTVAAEHPAAPGQPTSPRANARSTRQPAITDDPYALADATLQLADLWPWSRLRHDPDLVDTAQAPLPRHLTEWMDDGMFARWVLSDLVALDTLASAIDDLLPPAVSAAIAETVTTAGGKWPARSAAAGR